MISNYTTEGESGRLVLKGDRIKSYIFPQRSCQARPEGWSRRVAVKREKELRQRFLSSEDGAEHDDRAGLSLQAHIISGNDEEKDWTMESAKQRNAAAPEQSKICFFPPSILYNLYYIAPEVQGLIDPCQENPGAMDMWSLGIIVYFSGDQAISIRTLPQ